MSTAPDGASAPESQEGCNNCEDIAAAKRALEAHYRAVRERVKAGIRELDRMEQEILKTRAPATRDEQPAR